MRDTGPKARKCRRFKTNLYGPSKYTKILERRPGKPGMHGAKFAFGKSSEYGIQLLEKQKSKALFGISEKRDQNPLSLKQYHPFFHDRLLPFA